jgi:hypothetical protein
LFLNHLKKIFYNIEKLFFLGRGRLTERRLTDNQLTERLLTESPIDRTPIDRIAD